MTPFSSRKLKEKQSYKHFKFASWNIRTLQDTKNSAERRTAVISKILQKYDVDIAALSETRFAGNGILQEKDYNFYWIGRSEEEARSAGVGFAIRRSIANDLVELPIAINERLMTLRIPLSKSNHVTLLSAYAPTMTSSDSTKEHFYEDLSKVLKKIPNEDKIILLGDFNARVGNDIEAWPKVLGKHLLGKMIQSRRCLARFDQFIKLQRITHS